MAKCTECNARKGKRKCKATGTFICSACCGQTRSQEKCDGCSFYKGPEQKRNYRHVPFYEIQEMSRRTDLQGISESIESALVQFYYDNDGLVRDNDAAGIVELLIDKYHFNDAELRTSDPLHKSGFDFLLLAMKNNYADLPKEELVKVLVAVYRSIQRRTDGRIEYINFVRKHVGYPG